MSFFESKCISWRVFNIHSIKYANSPLFSFKNKQYFLALELKTFRDTDQDFFTLRLKLHNSGKSDLRPFSIRAFIEDKSCNVHFLQKSDVDSYWMHDSNGQIIWSANRIGIVQNIGSSFGTLSKYVCYSHVDFVVLCGEAFTWIDKLERKSENKTEKNEENEMMPSSFRIDNSSCLENLSSDFRNLLENHVESDTKIKCEAYTFPVHKAILSSRSEVFAAMFRNDMLEKRNGSITITDLDPDILKQLLHYIYTGTLTDLTDGTALLLYSAAHKYAISALERRCGQFMMQNLSESSVCDCLLLAHVYSDAEFKDYVISFIIDDKRILSSDAWKKFCEDQLQLSNEVYREYVKKRS